jgi:putative ABC transport system permease protein
MTQLLWTLKMAWRDSRGSRKRLALYLSSMALGVAALVAINGFGDNLERTVDNEAKTLLGADLMIEREEPFAPETEALLDTLGGEQSRRIEFSSMAYFPSSDGTRLVSVRATEGGYPFYGAIQTRPASAAQTYRDGPNALLDGTLMQQYDTQVGDSVRIGTRDYRVAGEVLQTPRESSLMSAINPRVYIPRAHVDTTLFQRGSRVEYQVFFKFPEGADAEAIGSSIVDHAREQDIRIETVEEEAEDWEEGLTNLYRFLSLVGFIALLLGSLGVASAVHVYVRQRVETIAVLRCLGAKSGRTFRIYLTQAGLMGLVGATAGCLLGVGVQMIVPYLLADFLPVSVDFRLSWTAIGMGLGIGLGVTLLFALLPLLRVRNISPLLALRSNVESGESAWRDPLRWVVAACLAAGVTGFAIAQAPEVEFGLGYAGGVAAVFGLLALVAKGIVWAARRYFPTTWSYPWRQGLANLYRPHNQTTVLMLALGLGTFLIMTLFLVQRTVLEQIQITGGENRPNIVFFDVQSDQLDGVTQIVEGEGLPILRQVPIVTMRLRSVKGRTIDAIREDSTTRATWAHRREYRSTYRDSLIDSETLMDGEFVQRFEGDPFATGAAVPISIEQEIAQELRVGIGDTLTFNVQGVPLAARVASLREVDWQRIQTNFFVVFPEGVLENAPQMHVVLSRADTEQASARVQSQIVQQFPNVAAIDLSLVLSTFDALFSRLSYVIRFMALFSILTGLIVLVGAVVVSRYQRIEESVLLKTLGASRRTVMKIMTIEYLFLGVFAALTGLVLSLGGSWALSYFVFEGPFVAAPGPLLVALAVVTGLTIFVGLLNSRGIYSRPPLEVLRAEV